MKIFKTLILGLLAFGLVACSGPSNSLEDTEIETGKEITDGKEQTSPVLIDDMENEAGKKDDKLVVYSSIFPIYDFTNRIGGNKIDSRQLIPSGVGAHDFEPSSQDIINLEEADLIIINGNNLEGWADDLVSSLNSPIELCDSGNSIEPIGHNHASHSSHDHSDTDPHTWTSPLIAIKQMENIRNKLIEIDPANAAYYSENFNKAKEDFTELDKEYRAKIKGFSSKDLIVSHEAFAYMAKEYGLNQIGIEELIPDSEPTPQKMAEIIDFVKDNNIKAIYFEDKASSKVADAIANETGVSVLSLNTLESLTKDEENNGEDYLSLMKKNLKSLEEGLK